MKKKCKYGFTLVELMIAIVLFATLSVTVYNVLKGTMDSTLRQKTQQSVNDNAKSLLNMIVDDLRSSTPLNLKLPFVENDNRVFSYSSSVIFPTTSQLSNTGFNVNDVNADAEVVGFNSNNNRFQFDHIDNDFRNRFLFYTKNTFDENMNNNVAFNTVEYRSVLGDDGKCRVNRMVYDNPTNRLFWNNIGIREGGAGNLAIDARGLLYNGIYNPRPGNTTTLFTLPNKGDGVIIYVRRAIDDTNPNNGARFSANQYFVRVMVFQTLRNFTDVDYFQDNGENLVPTPDFLEVINQPNDKAHPRRNNYRFADISSSVTVQSHSNN